MTLRILLVEDDPLLRELVSSQLRASGFAVEEMASGEEAAASLAAAHGFDCLVTDISMPGEFDGWSLGRRWRALFPQRPVIYVSSGKEEPDRQVCNSTFIAKPYRPDALLAAINRLCA